MRKVWVVFFGICLGFGLLGCSDNQNVSGQMTVVVRGDGLAEYVVNLDDVEITDGMLSVLEYLRDTQGLALTVKHSAYGAYLTKVGELQENAANGTYLYVFTSVAADFDVSQYATTVIYNGTTLTSSGVGITDMTLKDGCVVLISYA